MLTMRLIILALAAGLMLPAFASETGERGGGRGEGRGSCQSFVDADGDGVCDSFVDADGDGVCDNRAQRRLRHSRLGPRDGSGRGEAARDGKGRGDGPRDGTGHGPRRGKRTGPQDQSGPGCNE